MYAIRFYREKADLTQVELAKRINLSTLTLSRYENGHREPRASDIKKLCEVLGTTEAELLNGPQKNTIEIKLVMSFEPMKGGITAMDMSGGHSFTLCVENGRIGIIGSGPMENENDIDSFLVRAKEELMIGLSAQDAKRKLG